MLFWPEVRALHPKNAARQAQLEELNTWRNAIAHQNRTRVGPVLHLEKVERWRSSCGALARAFDQAVGNRLARLVGHRPW